MEPHSSPRLLIIFLCFAVSIGGARSRLLPDGSPAPQPDAAGVTPGVSPTLAPGATAKSGTGGARLSPDVSKTLASAAARLGPGVSLDPDELVEGALTESPDQSPDVEEAAALVSQVDVPAAKQLFDGADIQAALNSVDQNTLKSLSSFI